MQREQNTRYRSAVDPLRNAIGADDRWTVEGPAEGTTVVTATSCLGVLDIDEDGRLTYTVTNETIDGYDAGRHALEFIEGMFDGGRDWYAFDNDRVDVTTEQHEGQYAVRVEGSFETADDLEQMLEYVEVVDRDVSARLGITDY